VDRFRASGPVLSHDQAIAALTFAERLAVGYRDGASFVIGVARGTVPVTGLLMRITTRATSRASPHVRFLSLSAMGSASPIVAISFAATT